VARDNTRHARILDCPRQDQRSGRVQEVTLTRCPTFSRSTAPGFWRAAAAFRSWKAPPTSNATSSIEFPTLEQAVACFESEEYRAAAEHRRRNGVRRGSERHRGRAATPRTNRARRGNSLTRRIPAGTGDQVTHPPTLTKTPSSGEYCQHTATVSSAKAQITAVFQRGASCP
jgi:hypothetical protein